MDIQSVRYPIYIVSKGRHENPLTAKIFLREKIDFKIVVEPQEYENYCASIGSQFVERLPFSNLGLGSYPARNWCWQNSIDNKFDRHFIFDDNIRSFSRLNKGSRTKCDAYLALKTLEDFTDRYKNVAVSGYNYRYFVTSKERRPFGINTHVYSGMLINNKIPHRWRLKYNEDVDLCLQALHDGFCTILLNVFLIDKISTTEKMTGGNQTDLYKNNDTGKKALKSSSLREIWPQYVTLVHRYGRPHHQVLWNKFFKQPLIRKS